MLADRFRGRNVLVTGGLGFIGSNLAIRLVECGAHVTLIDSLARQFGGRLENVEPVRSQLSVVIRDLREPGVLDALLHDCDYVFHLAGQVSHEASMRDPSLDLGVNCLATVNLLESCRRARPSVRVLYSSTRQVYGRPKSLPVGEDHPAHPIDVNGINKLAAEQYHLLYHRVHGIGATVLRLTNTFGPRQKISSCQQGFAGYFIYRALRGEPIQLYGGGAQRRDFNYVDDVVDAMLLGITTDRCLGETFNLGSRPAYSLAEFVEQLREFCEFEVQPVPFPVDCGQIEIGDYEGDYSRFQGSTGWTPRIDLRRGLACTVDFFRKHAEAFGLCPRRN